MLVILPQQILHLESAIGVQQHFLGRSSQKFSARRKIGVLGTMTGLERSFSIPHTCNHIQHTFDHLCFWYLYMQSCWRWQASSNDATDVVTAKITYGLIACTVHHLQLESWHEKIYYTAQGPLGVIWHAYLHFNKTGNA